jgi:hypothetical protein
MRLHRHRVEGADRWHSVRVRHDDAWDWCAHQEEIERHLSEGRKLRQSQSTSKEFKLQAAH